MAVNIERARVGLQRRGAVLEGVPMEDNLFS